MAEQCKNPKCRNGQVFKLAFLSEHDSDEMEDCQDCKGTGLDCSGEPADSKVEDDKAITGGFVLVNGDNSPVWTSFRKWEYQVWQDIVLGFIRSHGSRAEALKIKEKWQAEGCRVIPCRIELFTSVRLASESPLSEGKGK